MTKKLRQKLALRPTPPTKAPPALKTSSTIGSININGMDIEANWAVGQLLKKHDFDVSKLKICLKNKYLALNSQYNLGFGAE